MPHSGFGRTSTPLQRKLGRVWWIGIPRLEEFYLGDSGGQDKWEDTWGHRTFHLLLFLLSFSFCFHSFMVMPRSGFLPWSPVWQASKTSTRFKPFDRHVCSCQTVCWFFFEYFYLFWSNTPQDTSCMVDLGCKHSTLEWQHRLLPSVFMTIWHQSECVSDSFEWRQSMMLCHIQDSKAIVLPRFWTFESTFRSAPDRPNISEYYAAVFFRFAWA